MQFAVLGWPDAGPTLRLDFRTFRYAGKFVMSNTGKAVIRSSGPISFCPPGGDETELPDDRTIDPDVFEDDVVAAVAFNEDRTDPGVLWFRYITVHDAYRGRGLGAHLAAAVAERAVERGYRRLRIAVNNPFAYEALYKAGFVYTGRTTGIAELVLERPGTRDQATYQCGFDVFRERDLPEDVATFLTRKATAEPPEPIEDPVDAIESTAEDGILEGMDRRVDRERPIADDSVLERGEPGTVSGADATADPESDF